MNREEVPEIFVPLGECKKERLRVLDPVTHTFTKGDSEIEWCTSEGRYVNDEGVECEVYFELPEQFSFGTNASYPIGTSKEDKILDNMTGIQICYPITSMKTIENPTKTELAGKQIFDFLEEVTWDKMENLCDPQIDPEDRIIPRPAYNSYVAAVGGKTIRKSEAVKPPYGFPMVPIKGQKNKKEEDRSKPQRAYIKLITKGEGRNLRCMTSVYGPGDRKVSALKYIDVKGKMTPVIKWEGVFWGSHGQKAPYGASVRLRVSEMNFSPASDGGPRRRMLGRNTTPIEEDISDEENETPVQETQGTEQDEDFTRPDEGEDLTGMLGKEEPAKEEEELPKEEEELPKEEPKKKKAPMSSARRKELLEKKKRAKENK